MGTEDTENAAWEVSRVPDKGLSFFPSGEGDASGPLSVYLEQEAGISWYESSSSYN